MGQSTFAGDLVLSVSEWFIVIAEFTTDFLTEPGVIFLVMSNSSKIQVSCLSIEFFHVNRSPVLLVNRTQVMTSVVWFPNESLLESAYQIIYWTESIRLVSQKHRTPRNRSLLLALSEECDVLAVIAQYPCIYCISKLKVLCVKVLQKQFSKVFNSVVCSRY